MTAAELYALRRVAWDCHLPEHARIREDGTVTYYLPVYRDGELSDHAMITLDLHYLGLWRPADREALILAAHRQAMYRYSRLQETP